MKLMDELEKALAGALAPHGLSLALEDDEDFMSVDDGIVVRDASGGQSPIYVQVSNAGSPGGYAIVHESIHEEIDLGVGVPLERFVGMRDLGSFSRRDAAGIAACMAAGLERTGYATSKARGARPTAFDHPIMRPIAMAALETGLSFRPHLGAQDQGLVAGEGDDEIGVFAKDGTAEIRYRGRTVEINASPGRGDDWSRAATAIRIAIEERTDAAPKPGGM